MKDSVKQMFLKTRQIRTKVCKGIQYLEKLYTAITKTTAEINSFTGSSFLLQKFLILATTIFQCILSFTEKSSTKIDHD